MANVLGITLPIRRGAGGYFETTSDVMIQIQSNLTNLLLTQKGERPMQPTYGSTLASILFEQETDEGLANIQLAIESAVEEWMPFIGIEKVDVQKFENTNKVGVKITYKLLTNNIPDSITLVI